MFQHLSTNLNKCQRWLTKKTKHQPVIHAPCVTFGNETRLQCFRLDTAKDCLCEDCAVSGVQILGESLRSYDSPRIGVRFSSA